jgi:hypothetical protein
VAHNRIMNIAITTKQGAFYDSTIALGAATVGAEFCAKIIEKRLQVITKGKMKRMNALSTDICDIIGNTGKLLKKKLLMTHTFYIYCNPHSLNLLIGDIVKDTLFAATAIAADNIVTHFYSAKKQY